MTKPVLTIVAFTSALAIPGVALACDNHGPGEHPSGLQRFNPFAAELAALSQDRRTMRRDARIEARLGAGLSAKGKAVFI